MDKLEIHTKYPNNLTKKEMSALKTLSDNNQIIIKAADKGGNIVVLDNEKYVNMYNKIFNNLEWYRRIAANYVKKYNDDFYLLIDTAYSNSIITNQLWEFIWNNFPRIPVFYELPKIHKDANNPPGRPIISGVGAISENASRLVDEFLKPFVRSLPSFVKDN